MRRNIIDKLFEAKKVSLKNIKTQNFNKIITNGSS